MTSNRFHKSLLIVVQLTLMVPTLATANDPTLETGIGNFQLSFSKQGETRSLPVWYYAPPNHTPDSRIVIVMHGMDRNANNYLTDWFGMADEHSWLVVVPVFSSKLFPGREYRLGKMCSQNGRRQSPSNWSFALIERTFDEVIQRSGSRREAYTLFGHSAGAQFIHRMVLFQRDTRIELAIAANAGFYTMPYRLAEFPFGLGKLRYSDHQLQTALAKPLCVMLGDNDTEINSSDPRSLLGQQGQHRLERGQRFIEQASLMANRMKVPLNWQMQIVSNVGHDHYAMAQAAGELIAQYDDDE